MEWPLFDLRLQTGPVLLRPVTDPDLEVLAALLPDDVELDPRSERFAGLAEDRDRQRRFVQGAWRSRGCWSPRSWCLDLGVEVDGEVVGLQSLEGDGFGDLRTVDSASWLVMTARGRGLGTAMRAAALGLAFEHLGAVAAVSSAVLDNHSSLGVSRRLGYADNGISRITTGSGVAELRHLRLSADTWRSLGHRVEVSGVTPCLPWFGA
ncbi:MAG: GNAT family N-acetyltransferase [Nocardioides sp.]